MSKRIPLSFKDNALENELWFFLKEQSKLIGARSYLKELLYEDMLNKKDNPTEK
jgi:hypothetical protein